MDGWHFSCCRRNAGPKPRHSGHAVDDCRKGSGRDAAKNGGAEQNRLVRGVHGDFYSRAIGKKLADKAAAAGAATQGDTLGNDALIGLSFQNLAQAVSDAAEPEDVERDEAFEIVLHANARDHRTCLGST